MKIILVFPRLKVDLKNTRSHSFVPTEFLVRSLFLCSCLQAYVSSL
ncbi:hypothetical protein [Coleofasciculus sp. G2-EDA-02]